MVVDNLYTYSISHHDGKEINATVTANPGCPVYKGHFPGLAITPGVCQVLIIREILEDTVGMPLQLAGARNIKFTAIHEPEKSPVVEAKIAYVQREDGIIEATGTLFSGEIIFIKFKGEFLQQP